MSDIIRTWPASCDVKTVHSMFRTKGVCSMRFYFTLGRGKPKQSVERLWWTWRGRILGYYRVDRVVQNVGQLPSLHSISDGGEWNVRPDHWVAVCHSICVPLKERLFMSGFRYFNIDEYRATAESRMRL